MTDFPQNYWGIQAGAIDAGDFQGEKPAMTPPPQGPALPRSSPEAQGVPSSAVLDFLAAAERETPELHGLMLLRHGHVIAEGWWSPYAPQYPHMLFSLSKSFASTAAGLAVSEGLLSLDDPVLGFFPDEAPRDAGPNLAAMRVRHLLSMSTGHAEDTTQHLAGGEGGDWARGFLARPVEHEPGTHFVYNSGATYMASAIVQRVTGETVLDYLRPRLFEPLGIPDPAWEASPQGVSVGGWGLSVRTEDIARFVQLYLQRGEWQGRRLLPEAWVAEATSAQVSNGDDPESDWAQGYGFQFWRCRHGAYRGDGAFGQFCVVLPGQDAVVAVTAGTGNLQGVLDLVWRHLLPALDGPTAAEDGAAKDGAAQSAHTQRLAGLSLEFPEGSVSSPIVGQVSGRSYVFTPADTGAGGQGVESCAWDFEGEGCRLTLRTAVGEYQVEAGFARWRRGETDLGRALARPFPAPGQAAGRPIAAAGAWASADTYVLKACFSETPFSVTLTARFTEDRVLLHLQQNVAFGPTERPSWEGRAVAE
jgi:CubicO group peptidase (beta-lactamase class C family)